MNDDVYSKARDVVADVLDATGFTDQPYNDADRLIGKLDTAGYMVWPKREDWKRLDELEAERDQLRAAVAAMGDTVAYVLANYDVGQDALTHLYDVPEQATVALGADAGRAHLAQERVTDAADMREVHVVDGGYVIAENGSWLPGLYADEVAARLAFTVPDHVLMRITSERGRGNDYRPITVGDLASKGAPTT